MYGLPVAITCLKYSRSDTLTPAPFGLVLETRESPVAVDPADAAVEELPAPCRPGGARSSPPSRRCPPAARTGRWRSRSARRSAPRSTCRSSSAASTTREWSVVQRLLLAVVVLAPGEHAAEHARARAPPRCPPTASRRRNAAAPRPNVDSRPRRALVRLRRLRRREGHGAPSATSRRLGRRPQRGVDVLHDGDDLREADDVEHAPRLGARRGEHARPALRLDRRAPPGRAR